MRYVMRASAVLAMALTPLNGCARDNSEAACLNVSSYSTEEQMRAANELAGLGLQSETGQMIADYGRLREEARALCP